MKKTFKCIIKTASPIHIGCDEVYEPTGFGVEEENNCIVQFEFSELITALGDQERERLSSICCQGDLPSILKLYKFFQGRKVNGRKISVTDDFVAHYRDTLKMPENDSRKIQNELNKFIVERTAFRTWDSRAYLPGSSIKGALRTGYLNHICNGQKVNTRQAKDLEQKMMGYKSIDEDPFALVKVSDFQPVGDVKTKIVYAVNKKKKISDKEAQGPYQILEVIEPGSMFTGEISVLDAHPKSPINRPVELETLLIGANRFFINEHVRENEQLSIVNIHTEKIQGHGGERMLCRIGRHSGAESVTIAGNRSIKIMLGQGKSILQDHSTTFWLASPSKTAKNSSGLTPFGWTCIQALSSDHEQEIKRLEKEYQQALAIIEQNTAKAAAQLLQKEAEIQKKIAEEQAKIEQEKIKAAQKQAELEAMKPEDRELSEIFDSGNVLENKVVELFNRLDEMEEAFRQKSAQKIKAYYQKNGKWEVNKNKKKQFAKVNKLKTILGDNT